MSNPDDKIVIRPEDLPSKRPDTPITVHAPAAAPKLESINPTGSKSEPRRKSRGLVLKFLMFSVLLLGTIFAAVLLLYKQPERDWIEFTALRAEHSVVRIECMPSSLGTGFVIASSGNRHLILTNQHVISNPEQCRVVLRSGRTIPSEVAGLPLDEDTDLALMVVQADGLRPMGPIARFRDVRVGEPVVAVGHPLGLDYTITDGIISAKRGSMELQTSAPISPGNSGGPLVNKEGYVLGVNTRIVNPAEGQMLGFSVRADLVFARDRWEYLSDVSDLLDDIER